MSAWQTWHTPQQLEHANAYYVRLYGGTSPAARKQRLREAREGRVRDKARLRTR